MLNRRRVRGRRGRRMHRCRGAVVDARLSRQLYEPGGSATDDGCASHDNRPPASADPDGRLQHRAVPASARPDSRYRSANQQQRALSAICRLIARLIDRWKCLTRAWRFKWTPTALVGSIAQSPSCLNRPAQQTDFFHGLIWILGSRPKATGLDAIGADTAAKRQRPLARTPDEAAISADSTSRRRETFDPRFRERHAKLRTASCPAWWEQPSRPVHVAYLKKLIRDRECPGNIEASVGEREGQLKRWSRSANAHRSAEVLGPSGRRTTTTTTTRHSGGT